MFLKSVEIQGFKTFPEKTVVSFGKGLTSIVGPNGSGKSNISDAIKWVMGEQSNKSLRVSKSEGVIFDGTDTRGPQSHATVTLVIDNKDKSLDINTDEVLVTRKYYRSGESEYLINKIPVRLLDINELLMDTGLGKGGYSIVSQGKISDIVDKSDDRRKVFEEAAGISKYRHRRHEAEKRLNLAEENLLRLRDILVELEGRVGPLKTQSDKAKKFLEYSERQKTVEVTLINRSLDDIKKNERDIDSKLYIAKEQYSEIKGKLAGAESEIDELTSLISAAALQIDELRRREGEIISLTSDNERDVAVVENEISHREKVIEEATAELLDEGKTTQELEAIKSEQTEKIAGLKEKLNQLNEQYDALLSAVETISQGASAEESNKDNTASRLAQLTLNTATKASEIENAKSAKTDAENRIIAEKEELATTKSQASTLNERYNSSKEVAEEADDELSSFLNVESALLQKLQNREAKQAEISSEIDKLRYERTKTEQQMRVLVDLEKSMDGYSGSIKEVLKASATGKLRGIRGTLSSLIKTGSKFAVAVETALGAAMQNVVVESEEYAKGAIAHLKETRAGRATFLPLTSIKGGRSLQDDPSKERGFEAIAADVVDCNGEYRGIVSNFLSRTVIATDIDAAAFIAKKYGYRFKVVSLDGQTVNAGGSFTGGSLFKNAGVLSRGERIEKLKSDIAAFDEKINGLLESLNKAEYDSASVKADHESLLSRKRAAEENKLRADTELLGLSELIENGSAAVQEKERSIEELTLRIEKLIAVIEAAEKYISDAKVEEEELRELLSKQEGQSREIAKRLEEQKNALSELNIEKITISKDLEVAQNELVQIEERERNKDENRAKIEEKIVLQKAEIEELNAKIASIASQSEQGVQEISEIKAGISKIIEERNQREQKVTTLRSTIKDEQQQKEELGAETARLSERLESITANYEEVLLDLWERYEFTKAQAQEFAETEFDKPEFERELRSLKSSIKSLGNVNVAAIDEYIEVNSRYEFMKVQVDDSISSRQKILDLIKELTLEMEEIFKSTFDEISENFTEVFKELFGGGKAKLTLTDNTDVLNCDIDLEVAPPGKKERGLLGLSGGERALIATSIYFALLKTRPAPFCLYDEVDAPLDDINVYRYANILRKMSDNTQFICITHRRGTMEESDVIYGVTMQQRGISKLLKMDIAEIAKELKIN